MQIIIHKPSQEIRWRGPAYLVDGKPGVVNDPLAVLDVVDDDPPEPGNDETVEWQTGADIDAKTYGRRATVRPLTADEIEARLPKPPHEVGAGQIRVAMIELGFAKDGDALDTYVFGVIDSLPILPKQKAQARVLWKHAAVFRRDNEFIQLFQIATNRTDADMDAIYFLADTY
jgi:hypothetical protein